MGTRAGRAIVEAGSDLAGYLAKMLGTVPEDLVGLAFGDALKAKRFENAEKILDATFERLAARGIDNPEQIATKQIQPLLGAISEESDESLQTLWADLLANTMDPNKDVHLQNVLIDALRKFETVDAITLKGLEGTNPKTQMTSAANLAKKINLRFGTTVISLTRLHEIGCLYLNTGNPSKIFDSGLSLSALGEELLLACDS